MACPENGLSAVGGGLCSPRLFGMYLTARRTQRLGRHLLACLVALCLLALSPDAFASTFVPMCGERAETVAAPPPMRAADDASISAPCAVPDALAIDPAAPARSPELASAPDVPPRMPAVYYRLPESAGPKSTVEDAALGGARAGFNRGLERPPR